MSRMYVKKAARILFLLLTGLLLAMLAGCSTTDKAPAAKAVTVVCPETQAYNISLEYTGLVQPKETQNYAFLFSGKIAEIYVEKGDYVAAGQRLARLDTTQLELTAAISANGGEMVQNNISSLTESLQAANEALATTERNLERYEALYADGALALADLEKMRVQLSSQRALCTQLTNELASAQVSAASSSLNQQQVQQSISDSLLTAKVDGVVMEIPFKAGEIVGAGYPVVITKSEDLMVKIGVASQDIALVSADSPVFINGTIEGKITKIAAYPDSASRSYAVEISFAESELAAGDTVEVNIVTGQNSGSFVPLNSIFQMDGLDYVYVVDTENRVHRQQIRLGEIAGVKVLVEGLPENAQVVAEGVKLLNENDFVAIISPEAEK